jgi:hypothetical protein
LCLTKPELPYLPLQAPRTAAGLFHCSDARDLVLYKNTGIGLAMMDEERHDFSAYEFFLERCAIRGIDGGLKRFLAEGLAAVDTRRYCELHGISEPMDGRYRLLVQAYANDSRANLRFDSAC